MAYRIGIDAGSKTIKMVILDEEGNIVRSTYRRHRANIIATLREVVHDFVWRYGDLSARFAVTGSAGIEIASIFNIPFVQEVVATTYAVETDIPEADAIIELGGEDAKIVYLTGGLEQRMNATCAGGTGGFIDTIAYMLGTSSRNMSSLSMGANHIYPIASRCAVFAQTDVRPLLNAGAKKADIAGSALEAVIRQTLSGLACGRPIKGRVVFLGGPLEHIPDLVHRFRKALGLNHTTGIKPTDAHLFVAKGAALLADRPDAKGCLTPLMSLSHLEQILDETDFASNDIHRLAPLFDSEAEYERFIERHRKERMARSSLFEARGNIYLGIDAGSTAVKFALVDTDNRLLYSDYQPVSGDTLKTSLAMLEDMYAALPKEYDGTPLVHIAHVTVTGYGEDLLIAGLKADSGVVETIAHTKAAQLINPDVDFILDIGGQDMKALWVNKGIVENAVLNEACSSGCGSFIEGTAHSLRLTPYSFSKLALEAKAPVDLGTKCTVFMTSRVKHAQKAGIDYADISAGIAYSVIKNALFKIIGMNNLDAMGTSVVVQGGAFLSDAVLRAFELISGRHAFRPDTAHLMGAIGAATVAKQRSAHGTSTLISREEAARLTPQRKAMTCPGCENACTLTVVEFDKENQTRSASHRKTPLEQDSVEYFISGNRCERAFEHFGAHTRHRDNIAGADRKPPNLFALEQKLIRSLTADIEDVHITKKPAIGLIPALNMYHTLPFWHALFSDLGFAVFTPRPSLDTHDAKGLETIPSESVCYPAKTIHQRLFDLIDQGIEHVFMPTLCRGTRCPVSSLYPSILEDCLALFVDKDITVHTPSLAAINPESIATNEKDLAALLDSIRSIDPSMYTVDHAAFAQSVTVALGHQRRFQHMLEDAADKALIWIAETGGRGIVLAGRPYHTDADISHGIDSMLSDMGFAVFSTESLRHRLSPRDAHSEDTHAEDTRANTVFAWKPGKHARRITEFVQSEKSLDIVFLQSFGCSFDALSIEAAEYDYATSGQVFTKLKIDEISDHAHIRIRLRTLAETIVELQSRKSTPSNVSYISEKTDTPCADSVDTIVPPANLQPEKPHAIAWRTLSNVDLETARQVVNGDICSTAAALAGSLIHRAKESPQAEIAVPEACISCLTIALPDIAAQTLHRIPKIATEIPYPKELSKVDAMPEAPNIGIVGNPLLCFDERMNEGIVQFIQEQGCNPILPDPALMLVDDVRYINQLAAFGSDDVHHIIYLQSFGCLKGHVQARGALREWKMRFPQLTITVIDYDQETSALNRENRIRLVLEAAQREHKRIPEPEHDRWRTLDRTCDIR